MYIAFMFFANQQNRLMFPFSGGHSVFMLICLFYTIVAFSLVLKVTYNVSHHGLFVLLYL